MTTDPATAVLDGLQAVPGGFGQPTFGAFYDTLVATARAWAASGGHPPTLLVMGEPLAGKSTVLSQLIARLTRRPAAEASRPCRATEGASPTSSPGPSSRAERERPIRPYLVRWGDTIRAAKQRGAVAPDRQFGDLTADEFARTSALLAEAAAGAAEAARGTSPALVVVEAPGLTMVTGDDGRSRGLDRGYSLARTLATQEHGFLLVLCAEPRIRDTQLASRQARLERGGPEVREATQLAANRIHEQVTDLVWQLADEGRVRLPEPAPDAPLTRDLLAADPAYRAAAVLRAFVPYLLQHDLKVPSRRAFVGLNRYLGAEVRPDLELLDACDWTHRYFGL